MTPEEELMMVIMDMTDNGKKNFSMEDAISEYLRQENNRKVGMKI